MPSVPRISYPVVSPSASAVGITVLSTSDKEALKEAPEGAGPKKVILGCSPLSPAAYCSANFGRRSF